MSENDVRLNHGGDGMELYSRSEVNSLSDKYLALEINYYCHRSTGNSEQYLSLIGPYEVGMICANLMFGFLSKLPTSRRSLDSTYPFLGKKKR